MATADMDPGEQFIMLYNQLDHWLRDFTGTEQGSFFNRVDRAARRHGIIRRHAEELKDFAELRNAIIHHARYPEVLIATPHPEVLSRFKRVMEQLVNPIRLIPAFERKVTVFSPTTPLTQALAYIASKGYSQVPVATDGILSMLTNDGLARWLTAQVAGSSLDLAAAKVSDVLPFEPDESFVLMSRYQTVDEARSAFEHTRVMRKPRLYAILITENGAPGEALLGIVAPYDLVEED